MHVEVLSVQEQKIIKRGTGVPAGKFLAMSFSFHSRVCISLKNLRF